MVLHEVDCFLQPPQIRHRVLSCSPGLQVIELGCPANHETFADLEMTLPTDTLQPEREWNGQRFVFHEASKAAWKRLPFAGSSTAFEVRDVGIAEATKHLLRVRVGRLLSAEAPHQETKVVHDHDFLFYFVLDGSLIVDAGEKGVYKLETADSITVPRNVEVVMKGFSRSTQLLEVNMPTSQL